MTRRRRTSEMVAFQNMSDKEIAELTDNFRNPVPYELKRIDMMEEEAWKMYLKHGGTVTDVEETESVDENNKLISKTTKTKKKNDPRIAMQWFDRILMLQEKRLDMLIFDMKRSAEIHKVRRESGSEGYDPAASWPQANGS